MTNTCPKCKAVWKQAGTPIVKDGKECKLWTCAGCGHTATQAIRKPKPRRKPPVWVIVIRNTPVHHPPAVFLAEQDARASALKTWAGAKIDHNGKVSVHDIAAGEWLTVATIHQCEPHQTPTAL